METAPTLFDVANRFFHNLEEAPQGQAELRRFDRKIQFALKDDESFFVDVKGGKVTVNRGMTDLSVPGAIHFVTDKETMLGLLRGRLVYTDLYSPERERRKEDEKGKLYVQETPGVAAGMVGGALVRWVGSLVRIGQELR